MPTRNVVLTEHLDERSLSHACELGSLGVSEPTLAHLIDQPEKAEVQ